MSWKATAYVKELVTCPNQERITRSEKLVLFVLADCHNADRRVSWPKVPVIAELALMDERTARYTLRSLEEKKVLKRVDVGYGPGAVPGWIFLELDVDPTLQHTIDHENCPACEVIREIEMGGKFSPLQKSTRGKNGHIEGGKIAQIRGAQGGNFDDHNKERTKNLKATVKPSGSDEPDPRHSPIRDGIRKLHARYNGMAEENVPWDGREGGALAKLLVSNPRLTVGDALVCAGNRYDSVVNRAERIGRWLPSLLEYWSGPLDEYRKPLYETGRDRRNAREACVGVNR